MGSETIFGLRTAGYRGDLGKRSMGCEPSLEDGVEYDWISMQGIPALKEQK